MVPQRAEYRDFRETSKFARSKFDRTSLTERNETIFERQQLMPKRCVKRSDYPKKGTLITIIDYLIAFLFSIRIKIC